MIAGPLQRDLEAAVTALAQSPPDVRGARRIIAKCQGRLAKLAEPKRLRGTKVDGYSVEDRPDGPVLIERRADRPSDFVIPVAMIEVIAAVLAEQDEPIAVRDLGVLLARRGVEVATWKLRVAMRFLSDQSVLLALRSAGRFEISDRRTYLQRLKAAWKRLHQSA